MQSTISPLVKSKGGDVTDVNNYRAITISNAITKIFETVIIEQFYQHLIVIPDSDVYNLALKWPLDCSVY